MTRHCCAGLRVVCIAALTWLLAAPPAASAAPENVKRPEEDHELIFFGVVTVRDGEYVLFQNPDLEGDALEKAQRQLAGTRLGRDRALADETAPLLDRVRHALEVGEPFDPAKKPDKVGLVPYRFYAVSLDQPVSFSEVKIDPKPQHGWNTRKAEGCVEVECWLPEDVEDVSLSAEYWFADDYEVIGRLEGEQLKAGAAGQTAHGMKWRITGLAELDNSTSIVLEMNIKPEAERLLIRAMTPEGEPMPSASGTQIRTTRPDEGLITHEMRLGFGNEEAASLGIIDLCAPDPERVKELSIRAFPVSLKHEADEPGDEPTENNNGDESQAPEGEAD